VPAEPTPATTKDRNDSTPFTPQHNIDPFTGTPAAGPLEKEATFPQNRGGWGLAARWIILAFLIFAIAAILVWARQ
jgi:hypothetical protein